MGGRYTICKLYFKNADPYKTILENYLSGKFSEQTVLISMSKIVSPSIHSMKVRFLPADGVKNINWSTSLLLFPYNLRTKDKEILGYAEK